MVPSIHDSSIRTRLPFPCRYCMHDTYQRYDCTLCRKCPTAMGLFIEPRPVVQMCTACVPTSSDNPRSLRTALNPQASGSDSPSLFSHPLSLYPSLFGFLSLSLSLSFLSTSSPPGRTKPHRPLFARVDCYLSIDGVAVAAATAGVERGAIVR